MNVTLRRTLWITLLVLLFAGAQCVWASGLAIRGARPDFVLLIALVSAQFCDTNEAAGIGFAAGLITASLSSPPAGGFGSLVVSRTLTCLTIGWLEERLFRDHFLISLVVVAGGTLVAECLFFAFDPQRHFTHWLRGVGSETVYNTVLAIPVYLLVRAGIQPRKTVTPASTA